MACHIALWCAKYHVCAVLNDSTTEIRATICKRSDLIRSKIFVTTVSNCMCEKLSYLHHEHTFVILFSAVCLVNTTQNMLTLPFNPSREIFQGEILLVKTLCCSYQAKISPVIRSFFRYVVLIKRRFHRSSGVFYM